MRKMPKPGEVYRHFKGNVYEIITLAHHTETDEMMVVYRPYDKMGETFARPLDMFLSEVDHDKYPDVSDRYRFTLLDENDEGAIEGAASRGLNPLLTEFLDAETYEEKLGKFISMRSKVNKEVLEYVAISLDINAPSEDVDEKYEQILSKLKALERYECNRLRRDNET